jgi:hypothetical protein
MVRHKTKSEGTFMRASRVVFNLLIVTAAVFLSGCYVTSPKLPAGSGPIIDEQLRGTWQALDEEGKPDDTFLHFVKSDDTKPLSLVMVDDNSWTAYELRTVQVGKRRVYGLKQLATPPGEKPEPNYILGFYEVKGAELLIYLLDAKKLKALIDANKIKGTVDEGNYDKVTLGASPEELASFFASTDLKALVVDKPARAHRVSKPE